MTFLITLIYFVCQALTIAIILRAVLSWFPISPSNPFVIMLHRITEPILAPLRRVIPLVGTFDITPIVVIILLWVIVSILASLV